MLEQLCRSVRHRTESVVKDSGGETKPSVSLETAPSGPAEPLLGGSAHGSRRGLLRWSGPLAQPMHGSCIEGLRGEGCRRSLPNDFSLETSDLRTQMPRYPQIQGRDTMHPPKK